MTFEEILDHAMAMLQRRGRLTYGTLKRQFQLDDAALDDLKEQLLYAYPQVVDDAGRGLVWTGETDVSPTTTSPPPQLAPPGPPRAPQAGHPPQTAIPPATPPPREAERRQLTVMFCDLVGSTALSEQLDPEDLGDFVLGYQEMGRSAVERFGGSVAQYLGDGLLTYFGYPVAHEDDATRAVFAALTILESLDGLSDRVGVSGAGLAARVGIHTGSAVIGEMGSGDRSGTSVVGSTPNIAARLEAMAAQGTVLISDSTRRQLRSRFVLADLGTPELKGIDRPIHVWRVVGI